MDGPFNEQTYKDMLNRDNIDSIMNKSKPEETINYTIIQDDGGFIDMDSEGERITSMPSVPTDMMNKVHEVQPSKTELEISNSVKDSFGKLFAELNNKYGFEIKFDSDNFQKSFIQIIDGRNKRALDLFLSEAYSRFRSTALMMYLNAITNLSAQVLDPRFLHSESLSYADRFEILDRLYGFIEKVNSIYDQVSVPDSELKLEKLMDESDRSLDTNNEDVRAFLEQLAKNVTSK